MQLLLYSIVTLSLVTVTLSWPNGAPIEACNNLTPNHGVSAQNTRPPFEIVTEKLAPYTYRATIRGRSPSERFKGFILQGKNRQGLVIGAFNSLDVNYLSCVNSRDTVTHRNNNLKSEVSATWKANPFDMTDEDYVRFVATVVKEKTVFWTGISSGRSLSCDKAMLVVTLVSMLIFSGLL